MKGRALVSGASGFVGSKLACRLVGDGWTVHIVVRPESKLTQLSSILDSLVVHVHDGSTESMLKIISVARPDVVFHLASLVLTQHATKDVKSLVESNIQFGTQLLEAMIKGEARYFVNTGTARQHYEGHSYNPACLYAATKQAFEAIVQYYVEVNGLKAITLKLCNVYGPTDQRDTVFQLLARAAISQEPLAMSPGAQLIDLVHVHDVVEAYVMAGQRMLEGRTLKHEIYAVTSGRSSSLRDLVQMVESAIGAPLPIEWGARPYRAREVMQPWTTGTTLPGWRPKIGFEVGVREILSSRIDVACGEMHANENEDMDIAEDARQRTGKDP